VFGGLAGQHVTIDVVRQAIYLSPVALNMIALSEEQRAAVHAGLPVDWVVSEAKITIDDQVSTPQELRELAKKDRGESGALVLDWLDRMGW